MVVYEMSMARIGAFCVDYWWSFLLAFVVIVACAAAWQRAADALDMKHRRDAARRHQESVK